MDRVFSHAQTARDLAMGPLLLDYLQPGATQPLSISQTIRDFTTRTHNAGFHKVELMLNGDTVAEGGFDLAI